MKENLIKISAYEWFNCFFPGVIFVAYLVWEFKINLGSTGITDGAMLFCLAYFAGVVISRFGSLAVEPLAKRIKLIEWSDGYYEAEKHDPKLQTLLKDLNLFRSLIAMLLLCLGVSMIRHIVGKGPLHSEAFIIADIALTVLFCASYRKQSQYITKRINNFKKGKSHEENGSS